MHICAPVAIFLFSLSLFSITIVTTKENFIVLKAFRCLPSDESRMLRERIGLGGAIQSSRSPLVALGDIKGSVERRCRHDNTGRKPVLLSRALVNNNTITLPQCVCVCVCARLHFWMSECVFNFLALYVSLPLSP